METKKKKRVRGAVRLLTCSGSSVVRYAFAVVLLLVCFSSCRVDGVSERRMLNMCEKVLGECAYCGLLDSAGIARYDQINKTPTVAEYAELIEECRREAIFDDTVGSTYLWDDYVALYDNYEKNARK